MQPSLHRSAPCSAWPCPDVAAAPAPTIPATAPRYAPERTRLYALVQAHYPEFIARFGAQDRSLPKYVHDEFEEFLR